MRRRSITYVLVILALAVAVTGCRGPRLRIKDEQVTALDRSAKTMTWTATVENSAKRKNFLCRPGSTEGHGQVTLQAYLVVESDLANAQGALPAAGVAIPQLGQALAAGESTTTTQSPGPFNSNIDQYTHLLLTAFAQNANHDWAAIIAARTNSGSCKRLITTVLVPLP